MSIYKYLHEFQEDILFLDAIQQVEYKYYDLCAGFASKEDAERIKAINLETYKGELETSLLEVLNLSKERLTRAIYYEYDLDNNWDSHFFLCSNYRPLAEQDDDWACDWEDVVKGPNLKEFAEIYSENGFDSSSKAIGITLYLTARTVCAFASVCYGTDRNIPLCIGFHDQDPIVRISAD
ncbi:hypothetical protein SAMN04487866_1441 [Thermoactinomyces sp. DSM 45891]|uniref:hypothetical protein n=1 Tax=Thermoactinomyces sp. DSM 45891 TaxID=1761907 RepID=UPI00090F994E|nr:hypothetical protein [Thermoactinomyces sp. DSM 45891]SFX84754.1 hypothetical protein SAMN04487866_1441 [Thermoactinomyces sp. DSM 45891]